MMIYDAKRDAFRLVPIQSHVEFKRAKKFEKVPEVMPAITKKPELRGKVKRGVGSMPKLGITDLKKKLLGLTSGGST